MGNEVTRNNSLVDSLMRKSFNVHPLLFIIILAYLALGVAYAVNTPKWEVPDEPAHYNYVRHLAETGRFPVLQMGDYPHDYLEEIKAAKFSDSMSIDPIRYEAHQPPLYYLLAAVIYKATSSLPLDQQVVVLRLFSVALGGLLLYVAYLLVKEVFPHSDVLALATTAFVATVPMHIALTAAINNDALAELILSLLLLLAVRWLKDAIPTRRYVVLGGILLGLGLLTKTTIYPAVLLLAVVEAGRWWRQGRHSRPLLFPLVALLTLSLSLSFWWFARNVLTYGDLDLFGWGRHDAIVVGQPRTAEWVAQFGAKYVAKAFVLTTFKSFWAQFGWMGILVDERIYLVLFLLCAVVVLGLALFVVKTVAQPRSLLPDQRWALGLLTLSALLTFGSYGWYNLTFVQHQGRYLFPALVPLGLFFALGFRELIAEEHEGLLFALLFLGLLALDLICLFLFIVPYFQ
jgi:4-amino-4-deoxy-L-arabinose transferase-like glycosyltransferase